MATTIVTKSGSGAPTASDLVAGELAVDLTNKRLYTENSGGTVIEVGSNPYNFTANHDGSTKLATTATGIDVTGTVTADGLELATTASDTGVDLTLNGNKSTNGGIGSIIFENAGDSVGMIRSSRASANDAADMLFYTQATGGANTERMRIDSSGNVDLYQGNNLTWRYAAGSTIRGSISVDSADNITFSNTSSNTERMRIDASGNVGIGTAATTAVRLTATTATANHIGLQVENSNTADSFGMVVKAGNDANDYTADFRKRDNTTIMRIRGDGNLGIGTSSPATGLHLSGSDNVSSSLTLTNTATTPDNTWTFVPQYNSLDLAVLNNGAERLRIDASGNVGISNSIPSSFNAGANNLVVGSGSGSEGITIYGGAESNIFFADGTAGTAAYIGRIEYSHTSDLMRFYVNNSNAMTIEASGGIRAGTGARFLAASTGVSTPDYSFSADGSMGMYRVPGSLCFATGSTERMRIDASGNLLVGGTTYEGSTTSNASSAYIGSSGFISANVTDDFGIQVNRTGIDDGKLANFRRNGVDVGDISVSSGVVSYNAFMGSHYSETVDTDLLFGTVMEVTGELVDQNFTAQERLSKVKVSGTAESKNVYGTWIGGYDGGGETVAALGASWCRIASGVTLELGDLLVSNGDGTAKVQSDDIIRSMTIGKVTSVTVKETHTDGSFVVPVVLYCG
jgi:hypothetical protein